MKRLFACVLAFCMVLLPAMAAGQVADNAFTLDFKFCARTGGYTEEVSDGFPGGNDVLTQSIVYAAVERPNPEDFLWYTQDVFWNGVPAQAQPLDHPELVAGGWKALILYDPDNAYNSSAMEYLNVDILSEMLRVQLTLDWDRIAWLGDGEFFDESDMEDSVFFGEWADGALWASGAGTIRLTSFYALGDAQYAVGTVDTPDGIPAFIALVRPYEAHTFTGNASQGTNPGAPGDSFATETSEWGAVPLNQLIIVFEEGVGEGEAQKTIELLGGVIIGGIESIDLYHIETQSGSEAELTRLIDIALSMRGVETAFPNVEVYAKGADGRACTPLRDALYTDPNNSAHYKAIGMENAWRIIKGSGVALNRVNVGVLDSALYLGSNEYKGKVIVSGDRTEEPERNAAGEMKNGGLNHGTMVTNVIGADHENDGMVGIASILEEKLLIHVKNLYDGKKNEPTDYDENDITQGTETIDGVDYTYTMKALVYLKEQVESGATVINCSYGPIAPRDTYQGISKAYEKFFREIYRTHPDVVFVAAAGNEGRDPLSKGALNGGNYYPAGMKLPNVVTVGALNNDGTRAEFSNYAASENAEVTLSAPGVEMLLGVDENGQPVKASGTSFSTPQVSAAIALVQSISPGMDAAQIKDLLVQTAADTLDTESGSTPIPEGMGKGILRVDEAVLRAVNNERSKEGKSTYTMRELLDRSAVDLYAETGFREYTVRASVPDAEGSSVSLRIEVTGKCDIEEETVQSVQVGEEAVWNLTIEDDSVFLRIDRTDTEGCAFMTLKLYESVSGIYAVKGAWDGSALHGEGPEPLTDWRARVVQTDSDMTVTFLNNSGTVLTGTYDEITGVFVGIDLHQPANPFAATWWMQDNTVINFDFDSMPMTATGMLRWNWEEQTENHLFDWTKVDFEMLKVEELPQ